MDEQESTLEITVWRDSVTGWDDVFSPHEIKINIAAGESIAATLERILSTCYLPLIQGGKATWIVVGNQTLAVAAQQWSRPHFFVEAGSRTRDLIEIPNQCQIEFIYWCQVEPEDVVDSIVQGRSLPDRYGRDRAG